MNYAATLAVLMLLAFMFPLLVRFGGTYGFGRALSTTALMVLAAFGFALWAIRARVTAYRARIERLLDVRSRIERDPRDPRAYFAGGEGEHVGLLLLSLGRRREAGELIERYAELPRIPEAEVASLRASLARAARRRQRSA